MAVGNFSTGEAVFAALMMLIGVIAIVMLLTGAINAWSIGLLFLFAAMAVGLGVRTQRKRSRVQGNQ